uniref:Uncharacterized protein n=1 Tax=Podarcis muralis TaxID=64176 RepID=A0A670JMQ7_PODMU
LLQIVSCMLSLSSATLNLFTRNTYSVLQFLELLLATLHCQLFCLIKTMLQVLHCLVQVLLHPLQVGTGVLFLLEFLSHHGCLLIEEIFPSLGNQPCQLIQRALHGLHNSQVIPLQLINFLILLCNSPVNVSLHLVELKLDAQDFAFFVFQ